MFSQTKALAAQIEEDYDAIYELLTDALIGFHRDLSCDQTECQKSTECMASIRKTMGRLVPKAIMLFSTQQSAMKPVYTRDKYEFHCEKHGDLMELILGGIKQFNDDQCCKQIALHLEMVLALLQDYREMTRAEMSLG